MRTCYYKSDFRFPDSGVHFHQYFSDFPEMHDHDYWEFFIIHSGEIKHFTDKGISIIKAGTGMLVHPDDRHCFKKSSQEYQQINIMITDNMLRELMSKINANLYDKITEKKGPIVYNLSDTFIISIQNIVDLLYFTKERDGERFSTLVKLMWTDIIKLIYTDSLATHDKYPEWLNGFIKYVNQPENINKPISELAEVSGYSYSHLIRLFKMYTNVTLTEYITKIRLNYAAMLLTTTETSIISISMSVGYDSISHFSKLFKDRYKLTPKEYRRKKIHNNED